MNKIYISSPAVGKSYLMEMLAEKMGMEHKDINLSDCERDGYYYFPEEDYFFGAVRESTPPTRKERIANLNL